MIEVSKQSAVVLRSLVAASLLLAVANVRADAKVRVPEGWSLKGRAQTVLGPVEPDQLGPTLMHEHLFIDFFEPAIRHGYRRSGPIPLEVKRFMQRFGLIPVPSTEDQLEVWDAADITMTMIAKMRPGLLGTAPELYGGYMNKNDSLLDSQSEAAAEIAAFRSVGGRTLVDVTVEGIGRNPLALRKVAEATQFNIVMGTGWYRWPFHPSDLKHQTIDQLAQRMVDDIVHGAKGSGIKAGIIGEIPLDATGVEIEGDLLTAKALGEKRYQQYIRSNAPGAKAEDVFAEAEVRVLRAAARASRATGAAITLHHGSSTEDTLDIIAVEGGDLSRVIVGHADAIVSDPVILNRFLARGVTIQLDYTLQYFAPQGPVGRNQTALLDAIVAAIKAGNAEQILLSHDLCRRLGLKSHGGSGLAWIHQFVLPYLRSRGVSEASIVQIMEENPKRLLTFAAPRGE